MHHSYFLISARTRFVLWCHFLLADRACLRSCLPVFCIPTLRTYHLCPRYCPSVFSIPIFTVVTRPNPLPTTPRFHALDCNCDHRVIQYNQWSERVSAMTVARVQLLQSWLRECYRYLFVASTVSRISKDQGNNMHGGKNIRDSILLSPL